MTLRPTLPKGSPSLMREMVSRAPDERRFWEKVDKTSTCWLWTASVDRYGFGQFKLDGTMVRAHRHAWQLVLGTPAPVRLLRHRCPNLNCVNPDHLVVMDRKGSPNALAKPAASRFSEKVKRGTDCWVWTGSVDRLGRGQFRLSPTKMTSAHRAAWLFAHGDLPAGFDVERSCKKPLCVRPDHLALKASRKSVAKP